MLADPIVDDRLALLLTGMPDGVLLESEGRRLLWANPAGGELFGVSGDPREFIGADCEALALRLGDRVVSEPPFAERIGALVAARRPVHSDEIHLDSGAVFERDYIPLELADRSSAHLWHYRDVSAHHRLREDHAAAEARLATAVSELAAARTPPRRATRSQSDFLSGMSSEIRTPMNGVAGSVELLREGALSTDQRELVELLGQSAEALLGVLDDILDFSRVEAGQVEIRNEPFDLAALVEGAVETFAVAAAARGIELSSYVDPSLPVRVSGDPGCVRRILLDLVGNAVKFSKAGEVQVKVTARDPNDARPGLRITVSDTGPGIPAELVGLLFEPHTDGGCPRRGHRGSGLGLVICDRLTRLMGGATSVEATGPQGTMMLASLDVGRVQHPGAQSGGALYGRRVALAGPASWALDAVKAYLLAWQAQVERIEDPRDHPSSAELIVLDARGVDPAAAIARLRTPSLLIVEHPVAGLPDHVRAITAPVHRRRLLGAVAELLATPVANEGLDPPGADLALDVAPPPGTVLVAEDDAVNRLLILRQLARLGVSARGVPDCEQAVAAAARGDYGLILMDCRMPEMDGCAATRAIRRAESTTGRRVPIVALGTEFLPRDGGARLAAGIDDSLTEPLTLEALRAAVHRWMAPMDETLVAGTVHAALARLAQELGGRPAVTELVQAWLAEQPGLIARLERAGPGRDLDDLGAVAHRLTSSAAIFGAAGLAEASRKLGRDAKAGGAIAGWVATVLDSCRELNAVLSDWLAGQA